MEARTRTSASSSWSSLKMAVAGKGRAEFGSRLAGDRRTARGPLGLACGRPLHRAVHNAHTCAHSSQVRSGANELPYTVIVKSRILISNVWFRFEQMCEGAYIDVVLSPCTSRAVVVVCSPLRRRSSTPL